MSFRSIPGTASIAGRTSRSTGSASHSRRNAVSFAVSRSLTIDLLHVCSSPGAVCAGGVLLARHIGSRRGFDEPPEQSSALVVLLRMPLDAEHEWALWVPDPLDESVR